MSPLQIRPETPSDCDRIRAVTEEAFRGAAHTCGREHLLVDALRAAGVLALSLVAVNDAGVVGHVAASPVTVPAATGPWYGIGPVSVLPAWQRSGIGTRLMRAALDALRAGGAHGCVLVGDPQFYTRFGFKADLSLIVPEAPPEVTLNLRFRPGPETGLAAFHPAFLAALTGAAPAG